MSRAPAPSIRPAFYGPLETSLALNALARDDRLAPLDLGPLASAARPLAVAETLDVRGPLLIAAILLFLVDTLASLWLGGHLARLRPARRQAVRRRAAAAALACLALVALAPPGPASALEKTDPALVTRLAYVVTGNATVDATSRAGLAGLTLALQNRTAFEPGEPVAIDLAKDELAFFPLLYLPLVGGGEAPAQAAVRKLDTFMKNGGTIVFDTRDAMSARPGGAPSPESQALRRLLATLDVPELEPVPRDHVLTKTFYLLDRFAGRYATGETWVEALPPVPDGERRPARAGDGVSPIVITSNDLAAAWGGRSRRRAALPDRRAGPAAARDGDPRRHQPRDVRANRQLQGRSGPRPGPAGAPRPMIAARSVARGRRPARSRAGRWPVAPHGPDNAPETRC